MGDAPEGSGGCIDKDECGADGGADCDANATCDNIPGSFTCSCDDGWTGDGNTCVNDDECNEPNQEQCRNTFGGYECDCNSGYKKGDDGKCNDVDECATNGDNCDDLAKCENIGGS